MLSAYGWAHGSDAIDLGHDFYEVETLAENDRVRYTISPSARKEVLERLLGLNQERAAAERLATLETKPARATRVKKSTVTEAENLFGVEPAGLPDGAWVRPGTDDAADEIAALAAVLKAVGLPRPIREVRLATLLVMQPSLLTPSLTKSDAAVWRRLVGASAESSQEMMAHVAAPHQSWGTAVAQLRGTGRLVEDVNVGTWAPGSGLDTIFTGSWPDGRARMVLDVLRRRDQTEIIGALPQQFQQWVNALAA